MKNLKLLSIATGIFFLFQTQHAYSQCNLIYERTLDTVVFVPQGGSNCLGSVAAGTVLKIDSWGVADPSDGWVYTIDFDPTSCSTTGSRGKFDVQMSPTTNAQLTPAPIWLGAGTFINVENCCGGIPGGYFTLMGTIYQITTP